MRPIHALLFCAIALLGACSASADTKPDDNATSATDTTVTLQRSTCYGTCPSYTVSVTSDGQVSFEGHVHVQTGKASTRVAPERVANILAAVDQADFRSLKDSYVNQDDGCAQTRTDMPGVQITVADARGSKTVNFYYGCIGGVADTVKPRIDQLARTIDQQLDTARWIGTPTAAGQAVR